MRLVSIASGSSGNAIYVGSDNTHILVDAGISNKRIENGLGEIGLKCSDLSAVVITHEHSDHIKGLGVLARKYGLPIYATKGTIGEIKKINSLGDYPEELLKQVEAKTQFAIGDLNILPFSIDHDAAEPVAYRIEHNKKSIAVATDMGHYTQETVDCLTNLDAVLLESNHDVRMLESGPYPYYLKRRILGDKGHLSNENCGQLLCRILHDGLNYILLGHLSKENNFPDLAYQTVRCEISEYPGSYKAEDFRIMVASREMPSQVLEV